MSADQLRQIFREAEARFAPGRVDRETTFYFTFGSGPGEKWTAWIGPDRCEVKEGKHLDNADCVLKTTTDLFLRMVRDGYMPGTMDFMRGKIKSNDPLLLRELQKALAL